MHVVVALAPIGAFGAMAFTVAKFGLATLYALALLVGTAWAMMAVFIFAGLGTICRLAGIRLFDLLRLLRTELLVVLGTSSSETAIPGMMEKLPAAGVGRAVAGLVIPSGYSFNLDGVALTLPLSTLFVAQVYGIEMMPGQQLSLFVVTLFTSKGRPVSPAARSRRWPRLSLPPGCPRRGWRCCSASTGSCRWPGPSPTPSATPWLPSSSRSGTANSIPAPGPKPPARLQPPSSNCKVRFNGHRSKHPGSKHSAHRRAGARRLHRHRTGANGQNPRRRQSR